MTYTLFLQIEKETDPAYPIRVAVICEQDNLQHALADFEDAKQALSNNGFDNLIELDT